MDGSDPLSQIFPDAKVVLILKNLIKSLKIFAVIEATIEKVFNFFLEYQPSQTEFF